MVYIQTQKIEQMKPESVRQWNKKLRYKIDKKTRGFQKSFNPEPEEINTRKKLATFVYNNYGFGRFNVLFRSHKKNKRASSPVKRAELIIIESGDSFKYEYVMDKLRMMKWLFIDEPE